MDDRRSSALAGHARPAWARGAGLLTLAALLILAAGCAHSGSPKASASSTAPAKVTGCGSAKTAAQVPVKVEVVKGSVSCATAMRVEHAYAEAIRSGKEPGNGGGGPVKVQSWTCQGFATPVVLATGKASKCVQGGTEILEILATKSS